MMRHEVILKTLEEDGPQTVEELAARFSTDVATIRSTTAMMFFHRAPHPTEAGRRAGLSGPYDGKITCDRDGKIRLGDPTALLEVS